MTYFEEKPPKEPEVLEPFKKELQLLEASSFLFETLKKYTEPTRKVYEYELFAASRAAGVVYPLDLDKRYGEVSYDSVEVMIVKVPDGSSTKIELFMPQPLGSIYIDRDALIAEAGRDYIIDTRGNSTEIPRIPNAQVNDLLYSLTGRQDNLRKQRPLGEPARDELVIGEYMAAALEDAALTTTTHYTYEFEDGLSLWATFVKNTDNTEALTNFTLHYKNFDMEPCVIDIDLSNGLKLEFSKQVIEDISSQVVPPTEDDYAVALEIIDTLTTSAQL